MMVNQAARRESEMKMVRDHRELRSVLRDDDSKPPRTTFQKRNCIARWEIQHVTDMFAA